MAQTVRKKWLFIGIPIAVLVIAVFALSRMDIATSLVKEKAVEAVSAQTEAALAIENVRGNPLAGYRLEGVRLADNSGNEIFTARSLSVSVALSSLFSGSPALSELALDGARADVPGLMALLPDAEGSPGPEAAIRSFLDSGARLKSPVQKVRLTDTTVVTALGDLAVNKALLGLKEKGIDADVDLSFRELPVSARGALEWSGEGIGLGSFVLEPGSGKMEASGRLFPVLGVSGEMKEIELAELAALWPELADRGFAGRFGTTFRAEGEWNAPIIDGKLDFQGGSLSGFTLDDASSSWRYEAGKRSLRMEDVQASLIGIPVAGKMGFVFSQLPPDLDVDLKAAGVSLGEVAQRFPALKDAKGTVEEVKVRLTGRTDAIRGNVLVRTGDLEALGQKVGAGKAELIFDGSKQARFTADSAWLGRPVKGSGTFPLEAGRPVNMVLEAPGVPLDKLAEIRPELAPLKLQGSAAVKLVFSGTPGKDLGLKGVMTSDRLRIMGELFEGTRAEVAMAGSDLVIPSLKSSWNQARISGKGRIKALTSGNPELDLEVGVDALNLENLAVVAPALADNGVKGDLSGTVRISGPAASPKTAFTVASSALQAAGTVMAKEVSGQGELTLKQGAGIPVAGPFSLKAGLISVAGVNIPDASIKGSLSADTLKIDEVSARPGGGSLKGSGSVGLAVSPAPLVFEGSLKDVDLAGIMPLDVLVPVSGVLSGGFRAGGSLASPELGGDLSVPTLSVSGMTLQNLTAAIAGTPADLRIEPLSASVGEAPLSGKVRIRKGEDMEVDFGLQGKALDLAFFTSGLANAAELDVKGRMDLDVQGVLRQGQVAGQASLTAPSVQAMGLTVTEVNLPVVAEGGKAVLSDGRALLYGGTVKLAGEADLAQRSWKGGLTVTGTDLQPLTTALMKGKGSLSGKTDFRFDGNGNLNVGALLGSGTLSVGEGELKGFKGLDVLAKLHGTPTLGYRSIQSNFNVDTKALQLLPGTKALAPEGDPLYRHLNADGPLGFDKSLGLNINGNVNIQALNALLGGLQGLFGTAGQSPEAMLQGLVGGLTGGLTQKDFRDISFRLEGTTESPSLKDLKIEQKITPVPQQIPTAGSDIQAAPQKQEPSSPQEILQKKVLEKLLGD